MGHAEPFAHTSDYYPDPSRPTRQERQHPPMQSPGATLPTPAPTIPPMLQTQGPQVPEREGLGWGPMASLAITGISITGGAQATPHRCPGAGGQERSFHWTPTSSEPSPLTGRSSDPRLLTPVGALLPRALPCLEWGMAPKPGWSIFLTQSEGRKKPFTSLLSCLEFRHLCILLPG